MSNWRNNQVNNLETLMHVKLEKQIRNNSNCISTKSLFSAKNVDKKSVYTKDEFSLFFLFSKPYIGELKEPIFVTITLFSMLGFAWND